MMKMKFSTYIFFIVNILHLSSPSYCHGQSEPTVSTQDQSYVLNSQYQAGKTYYSQIDVSQTMDIDMGKDIPPLSDKRMRTMAVTLITDNGTTDVPFKLTFSDFQESSSGELGDPSSDMRLDTKIAGATGDIEDGHLMIKNICGVEPIYLDNMQNVLKPVFELAYLHFPKKAMRVGDSFQNKFSVDYPVGGFGNVETTQDMVITLVGVQDNQAQLRIETKVSGTFVFDGVAYPVTGSGISTVILDIENQYFTSFEKNHTDVITFNSGGDSITIISNEISSNRTVIAK